MGWTPSAMLSTEKREKICLTIAGALELKEHWRRMNLRTGGEGGQADLEQKIQTTI